MPPSLEATLLQAETAALKHQPVQTHLVLGDGVISRLPARGLSNGNGKTKPRVYDDGPLPVKPSQSAPREACIVGRVAEPGTLPIFTLKVGDVEIDDVGLHEILDYVSPYELERFEHQQFAEERETVTAALAAAKAEEERRRERRKEMAKRKGIIQSEEIDEDGFDSADPNGDLGRTGRARPTYKHLFRAPQERRRRRKRDPVTNELLPLSDDDAQDNSDINIDTSAGDQSLPASRVLEPGLSESPKRRRRKRDPQTGELLPLEPRPQGVSSRNAEQSAVTSRSMPDAPMSLEFKKRPRRRRHPITGELMPLGWKYDADAEEPSYTTRHDGMSPSMRRLDIAQGQQSKRLKLGSESSADDSAQYRHPSSSSHKASIMLEQSEPEISFRTSDLPQTGDVVLDGGEQQTRSPAKSRSTSGTTMLQPSARATDSESSAEPATLASFLRTTAARQEDSESDELSLLPQKPTIKKTPIQGKTSILNPVAAEPPVGEADDGEQSSSDDGEWFVEAIVGHKMSDPKGRPGKASVMLYHTKWEDYDSLTWEPAESFADANTVIEYRRRAGLDKGKQAIENPGRVVPVMASRSASASAPKARLGEIVTVARPQLAKSRALSISESNESDESDGYEIDKILAHHMSDPISHPGKPQTMLYKVKWVGFPESEATWEPKGSFADLAMLNAYRRKAGLKPEKR